MCNPEMQLAMCWLDASSFFSELKLVHGKKLWLFITFAKDGRRSSPKVLQKSAPNAQPCFIRAAAASAGTVTMSANRRPPNNTFVRDRAKRYAFFSAPQLQR